jgi:hypothetical protein
MGIDSLYIVQDDPKDWQEQSGAMASIYSNSYITLAAAVSEGPEAGIFTRGERYHEAKQTLAHIDCDGVKFPVFARKPFEHQHLPLLDRGWVLQECLLSPRIIYFIEEELSWACQEMEDCECGESDRDPYTPQLASDRPLILRRSSQEGRLKLLHDWRRVVHNYSKLDLTFPHDALPALSGIVQVFARLFDDEYLAGLWRKSIMADLLWYRYIEPESKSYVYDLVNTRWRAPSWSWVSTEFSGGPVEFLDLGTSLVQVVEAVVERAGKDPNGEVASAFLQLKAKALNATSELLPGVNSRVVVKISIDGMIITEASHRSLGLLVGLLAMTALLNLHPNRIRPSQLQRIRVLSIGKYTQQIPTWSDSKYRLSEEQRDAVQALGLRQEVRPCLLIAKDETDQGRWKRIGLMVIAEYQVPLGSPGTSPPIPRVHWRDVFKRLNQPDGLSKEDIRQMFEDGCKAGREIFRAFDDAPMQEFTIW